MKFCEKCERPIKNDDSVRCCVCETEVNDNAIATEEGYENSINDVDEHAEHTGKIDEDELNSVLLHLQRLSTLPVKSAYTSWVNFFESPLFWKCHNHPIVIESLRLTVASAKFSATAADYIEKRLDEVRHKLQVAEKLEEAKLVEEMQEYVILKHDLISLRKRKARTEKKEEREKGRKRKFTKSLYFAGGFFVVGLFTIGKDIFFLYGAIAFYTFSLLGIVLCLFSLLYIFWFGLTKRWPILNKLLENIKKGDFSFRGYEEKKMMKRDVLGRERRKDNIQEIIAVVLLLAFILAVALWYVQ